MNLKEEMFNKMIGCIVANNISNEYNGYMSVIFRDADQPYLRNKCEQASKASDKLIKALKIADGDIKKRVDELVERNSDIIFDITAMDDKDQKRIQSLIKKIKRERKNEHS